MKVTLAHARRLDSRNPKPSGNLYVDEEAIGFGTVGMRHRVPWSDVKAVRYSSDVTGKSRAGKMAVFGVFALVAKNTQDRTTILLELRDGSEVGFQVFGLDAATVRARLASKVPATVTVG